MTDGSNQPVMLPNVSVSLAARIQAAQQSLNPLREAAGSLLRALASTPAELDREGIAQYRQWLLHELKIFDQVCAKVWVQKHHAEKARYCLCAALDEAAQQSQWGSGEMSGVDWGTTGLAVTLGYDRQGSDEVFRVIDEALRDPSANRDLIALLYDLLNLGFRGRYRFEVGGRDRLRAIMASLQWAGEAAMAPVVGSGGGGPTVLAYTPPIHGAAPAAVVIGWQPPPPSPPSGRGWRWFSLGLLTMVVIATATYLGWVAHENNVRAQQAAQVPFLDGLAQRLSERLRTEIAASTASLTPNASHTLLTLSFGDMFSPGEAVPHSWVSPLIAAAGEEIAKLPLRVSVRGYTDNVPPGSRQYASNQALSAARAEAVRQILLASGIAAERVQVEGKGEAEPVASNATDQGRTRNRRVELVIERIPGL